MFDLPPQLPIEQQISLLEKLPDIEARNILWESYLRLVLHIVKKFSNTLVPIDDLFSIGSIGLYKAIDSYDMNKNASLLTYASRCIENEIKMYLRKQKKDFNHCVSLNAPISIDAKGNELLVEDMISDSKATIEMEDLENKEKVTACYTSLLNLLYQESFNKFLLFLYILGGKTQRETAKILGISQSYASRIYKRIIKKANSLKSYSINEKKYDISFFYKESILYVRISKMLFINDCSEMFEEEDADYFLMKILYEGSFLQLADIFKLLKEENSIK